jgi:DNA-binding transcriptional LysR family regulator
MNPFKLHHLRCFDAVIRAGSFEAAADLLNRTHPSVHAATKALEQQVGVALFDRSGYRVELTPAGRDFYSRVKILLNEARALETCATQLRGKTETELSIIIGDVCPIGHSLGLLNAFFHDYPQTRLNLHFETLAGPVERLLQGQADVILHHIDQSDTRLEFIPLYPVRFIPVVAPGFLDFTVDDRIDPEKLRNYPQCVLRDTGAENPKKSYYLIEGVPQWTVGDQLTKREVIIQGMGWGHLPDHLIEQDLKSGRLIPITGRYFQGGQVDICAARLRAGPHGPVANALWDHIRRA